MTVVAITGIGGSLGLRLVERTIALGWSVRGIDRDATAGLRARARGAQVVIADINDRDALRRCLDGADVVMHTAARVGEDGPLAAFEHDNVHGTDSVCAVMEELGLRHLIHVSSVMVYGFDYPPDANENTATQGQGNVYNTTKIAGERLVRERIDAGTLDAVILRPSELYGPGCKAWVDRPLELLRNLQFALPDRGRGVLNPLHVDNLIDAMLLVWQQLRTTPDTVRGQVFNITDGVTVSCAEFFGWHARMVHRPLPLVSTTAATLLLRLGKLFWWASARFEPISSESLRFVLRRHRYDIRKARDVLGYVPHIQLDAGMRDLFRYREVDEDVAVESAS